MRIFIPGALGTRTRALPLAYLGAASASEMKDECLPCEPTDLYATSCGFTTHARQQIRGNPERSALQRSHSLTSMPLGASALSTLRRCSARRCAPARDDAAGSARCAH